VSLVFTYPLRGFAETWQQATIVGSAGLRRGHPPVRHDLRLLDIPFRTHESA